MRANLSKRLLIVVAVALFAAGCGSVFDRRPPPPCPPIFILKDAGSLTRYKPGTSRDITDALFQGKIIDFQGVCDYNKERTKVDIKVELAFELSRGPANRDRKAAFQYFVAIPHFHPAPQGRNIFSIVAEFAEREQRVITNDDIQMVIPLDPKLRPDAYPIYLGFQLTRQELEDNRRVTKF
jgi:hypothetical protein